jgi:hypothetical protein
MLTTHRQSGEVDFAIEREWIRSPPETARDARSSILRNLEGLGPHAANYLFNSMPSAYTWFYH